MQTLKNSSWMKEQRMDVFDISTCSRDMLSCSAASKEGETSWMGERVASPPRGADTAPLEGGPPEPFPPPRTSPLPWRYT